MLLSGETAQGPVCLERGEGKVSGGGENGSKRVEKKNVQPTFFCGLEYKHNQDRERVLHFLWLGDQGSSVSSYKTKM